MASQSQDKIQMGSSKSEDIAFGDIVKPVSMVAEDEELAMALSNYVPNTVEEKRLVRKIDLTLLPCLWWMQAVLYVLYIWMYSPRLGGIMAGAIVKSLDWARGIPGWRWLFIVEGVLTVVSGFSLYFLLPDYPCNVRYFSSGQRRFTQARILADRRLSAQSTTRCMTLWQAFKAVLMDGKAWFFLVTYSVIILGLSVSYFVPTILKTMGYTDVTAQWMTVPIWVTRAACQVALSRTSDKCQDRRWHSVSLYGLSVMACIASALISSAVAKYVMMFLIVAGLYTGLPLMLNWTSETIPFPDHKRSVAIAFVNSFGHLAIIYGSYLWPSSNAPQHLVGFTTLASTCSFGCVIAVAAPWYFELLPQEPVTRAERNLMTLHRQDHEMQ
ncbi:hypothetical protein ACHAPO_010483 [Fusarium lateritium]